MYSGIHDLNSAGRKT